MNINVNEVLPFLIPLIIVQFTLLGYTLYHIYKSESFKRGTKTMWFLIAIVGMEFIGPILYFVFGKED